MQADKEEPAAAAAPAGASAGSGKAPSICDRLQRAFHARPAFRPLRRLTVRHEDSGAARPAGAGDGASAAPAPAPAAKHSGGPPLPAAPPATATAPPQAEQPVPVRLPAITSKVAAGSAPTATGPPVPVPPPDVMAGMATAAGDKAGDVGQQTKGKTRVGSRVRKALSSK